VEDNISNSTESAALFPVESTSRSLGISRTTVMLVAMITLAILSQFYRSSNGVIAPELMHELGIHVADIGLSSGAFFVIFALFQVPIGVLFDRHGPRRVVSLMLIFAVIGSALFAAAQSVDLLVAGRFLIGLGFAGGMAGSLVILSRWHSPSNFTRAMTVLFAAANLGSLLATLPLAAANAWIGWRSTFYGLAVLTAVVGAIFYLVVRDAPATSADRGNRPGTLMESLRGIGELFRIPGFVKVLPLIGMGYASVVTIVGLWGGPYLHDVHGLDGVARGNLLSIIALALVVGTLAYGPLQRWAGAFRPVVIFGGGASALLMLAMAALSDSSLAVAVFLLVAICFVGAYSVVLMAHGVAMVPAKLSGRGTTTLNAVLMGGTALLQIVSGEVISFVHALSARQSTGYAAFFVLLGVLTLVALAIYHRAPEPPRDRA
jgi:predicted MFS family arabinose efflux permease